MGCFSFLCQECGKGIQSTSFSGQQCKLWLLADSAVIDEMQGEYDSYGRVFIDGSQRKDVKHSLRDTEEWEMPWDEVCNLMFSKDKGNGIAAVHLDCWDGQTIPTQRSEDDPNQGWGEDGEDFFSSSPDKYSI